MLDRSRHMLITEFSTSRGLNEAEAVDMLEKGAQPGAVEAA